MHKEEFFTLRSGTGGKRSGWQWWTFGSKRFEVDALQPAITGEAATASPDAPVGLGKGTFFFRNDGAGKSQFCVRFPSGAVQILATEP